MQSKIFSRNPDQFKTVIFSDKKVPQIYFLIKLEISILIFLKGIKVCKWKRRRSLNFLDQMTLK